MKNIEVYDSLVLQPGQLISVSADAAFTLRVDCGCVWVTIEGDATDYWLFRGDSLLLAPARHVVIEAHKVFSRVDFQPAPEAAAAPVLASVEHCLSA